MTGPTTDPANRLDGSGTLVLLYDVDGAITPESPEETPPHASGAVD
jgi:hypothetical protein